MTLFLILLLVQCTLPCLGSAVMAEEFSSSRIHLLCEAELACPQQDLGLEKHKPTFRISAVNDTTNRISKSLRVSWDLARRQFRTRSMGVFHYDYSKLHCRTWMYGKQANAEVFEIAGGVKIHYHGVCAGVMCGLMFFLALLGEMVVMWRNTPRSPLENRDDDSNPFDVVVVIARGWKHLALMMAFLLFLIVPSSLDAWPTVADYYCSTVFGADNKLGAEPGWIETLRRHGVVHGDHFVTVDELVVDTLDDYTTPATLATVYRTISFKHAEKSLNLIAACENSKQPTKGVSSIEFQQWLELGGYECKVIASNKITSLYIGHKLLKVRRFRVLSKTQTQRIIELTTTHTQRHGWSTNRHKNYATTDVAVAATTELQHYLKAHDLGRKVSDIVFNEFDLSPSSLWGLAPREMFVVKYAVNCRQGDVGCGQSSLDMHMDGGDDTVVSFNILLNDVAGFSDGGTEFAALQGSAKCDVGMAVAHGSKITHGGALITNGTRYILVGFMEFDSILTPFYHRLTALREIGDTFTPETFTDLEAFIMRNQVSIVMCCSVGFVLTVGVVIVIIVDYQRYVAAEAVRRKQKLDQAKTQ
eukprot:m.153924 g.153924  ORF g.153924 m.153924 type:complete len:587 (-) comp30859_c0_seq5:208-1968(-)